MPSQKILEQKAAKVEALAAELKDAKSIVISDYQGLTVAQDTEMRKAFRAEQVVYRVYKNSISKRALEKIGVTDLEAELNGPTALAWSTEDVVAAPRLVKKYADQFKKTQIKGGIVDGEKQDLETIKALAEIPSTEILYGRLVSTLIFPVTALAMTLNALAKKAEESGSDQVSSLVAAAAAEEKPAEAPVNEASEETVQEEKPVAEEAAPEA